MADHCLMSGLFFLVGGGRRGVGSSFSKGGMPNFTIFASISRVVNRNRWQDASHPNLNLPTGWGVLGGSSNLVFGKGSWSNPTGRGLATTMVKKTTSKSCGLILQVGAKTTPFSNPNHPPPTIHWDPPSSRSQQKSFCPTKKTTSKIEDWTLIFSIPTSETPWPNWGSQWQPWIVHTAKEKRQGMEGWGWGCGWIHIWYRGFFFRNCGCTSTT